MSSGDFVKDSAQLFEEAEQSVNRENTNEQGMYFGKPVAQLEDELEFKSKDGKSLRAYPVLVDFRRLLELGQTTETSGVIPGISNQNLLHAVVGLLKTGLQGVNTDCFYYAVCEKRSRTILMVRDKLDTIRDMTEHKRKKEEAAENANENNNKEESDTEDESDEEDDEVIDSENDFLEMDEMVSQFEDVFSDTDDEEEEDEDSDSEESDEELDFTKGVKSFILSAKQRRKERDNCEDEEIQEEHIGIENMLMGCAVFEETILSNQKERVIHLTYLAVRRQAKKMQMGRYLLTKCMDRSVVGLYDAVVVHAGNDVVNFYKKFGFSDDWLLNSKWRELAKNHTFCTLMSYVPVYSLTEPCFFTASISSTEIEMIEMYSILKDDPEISELEEDFKKWQRQCLEAYQSQALCMKKMQHKVLKLKCLVGKQQNVMYRRLDENDVVEEESEAADRELETIGSAYEAISNSFDDDISTYQLIRNLERHAIQDSSQHRRLSPGDTTIYFGLHNMWSVCPSCV